jgi:Domain of unknown function (DUF4412)
MMRRRLALTLAMLIFLRACSVRLETLVLVALLVFVPFGFGGEKPFEGAVTATSVRAGTEATHFEFTRKGDKLRIENTTNKLEPINIVDLAANKLTIIYPHNTTFVRVDLTKKAAQPDAPPLPTNPPSLGSGAAGFPTPPNASQSEAATGQVGPKISPPPGFPSPPPMPSMPQLPNNPVAPGMGMPSMPMMPPIPSMPSMSGATELKKTEKTKKIQGLECTLYTISDHGENFEIWASNDWALFPFQLITRDYIGHRFGPQMLEETWPELVRNKNLFPLEATLKMEPGGMERLSFKVDKIEKKKIEDAKLFQPPEKYIRIEAPQF